MAVTGMDTALYYTLSTISQTLAGALAVMVAFIVFKLPAIDSAIAEARFRLRQFEHVAPLRETWPILIGQGAEVLAASEQGTKIGGYFSVPNLIVLEAGRVAWNRRPWITRLLYAALGASAVTIAFCCIALAKVPSYVNHPPCPGYVLFTSVALLIVCLVLYAGLIVAVVGPPPD